MTSASELRELLTSAKRAVGEIGVLNRSDLGLRDSLFAAHDNLSRAIDNAEQSLEPRPPGSDFEAWLREQFHAVDGKVRVEALQNPHLLTREQAVALAGHVVDQAARLPLSLSEAAPSKERA